MGFACPFVCFSASTITFVTCVNIMFISKTECFGCVGVEIRSCVGEIYLKADLRELGTHANIGIV